MRFFVDVDLYEKGQEIIVQAQEAHHMKHVFRVRPGSYVELVNGRGVLAPAQVLTITKDTCVLTIHQLMICEYRSHKLVLALSNLRPNHLWFALEKGVELGVDHFVIFAAQRSEIKEFSQSKKERAESIVIAAMKQCGRLFKPKVEFIKNLEHAVDCVPNLLLWADLNDTAETLSIRLQHIHKQTDIAIFIGPESGWSMHEVEFLQKHGQPVLLHPNVLRAETAATVACYEISCWLDRV